MPPSTIPAVVVFLLIVAPGIAYELARLRRRPPRDESAFIEISRVLFGGVAIATTTLVTLTAGRAVDADLVVPAGQLIGHPGRYTTAHPGHVLASIATYLVIASTIAALLAEGPAPGSRGLTIVPDSAWFLVMSRVAPPNTLARVAVTTADGRAYVGTRSFFGSELRHDDRELVLEPPIKLIQPGQSESVLLPTDWHRLILPGSQITSMTVSFVAKPQPDDTTPPNPSRASLRVRARRLARRATAPARTCGGWVLRRPRWKALMSVLVVELAIVVIS